MDYSEGRQGDLEEPGVSLLRPHDTEWAVEMEGIHIDYYNGAKRTSISSGPLITLLNKGVHLRVFLCHVPDG